MKKRIAAFVLAWTLAWTFPGSIFRERSSCAQAETAEPAPFSRTDPAPVSGEGEAPAESAGDAEAEWTVLFYCCGTDLESRYGFASENLKEMVKAIDLDPEAPKVNVLVETGGCAQWHTEDLNMTVATDRLQRWRLHGAVYRKETDMADPGSFELIGELPLQSMADPETLTDFIRWGTENYPAKKTVLILWDHGSGAGSGMIIDELFDNDLLYLWELKQALADSGAQLDTIVLDACVMACIESVFAVKDYAKWLVASEEVVPGKGIALQSWLQELYFHPECDGRQLGRTLCDMTQISYANGSNRQAQSLMTWSVIDLSKADRLEQAADAFFRTLYEAYRDEPEITIYYSSVILNSEEYGDGKQDMRDFASVIYHPQMINLMDRETRNGILEAITDAVVYSVRGTGRCSARGLSFCYPVRFSTEDLNIYAKNYSNPYFLAYLDALTKWKAPASVYESVERLPEIDEQETLRLEVSRTWDNDGIPAIEISNLFTNVDLVYIRLYRRNEATGQVQCLGRVSCSGNLCSDENDPEPVIRWRPADPTRWIGIEGQPCNLEEIRMQYTEDRGTEGLYNILVQIDTAIDRLRCSCSFTSDGEWNEWRIYGVWEGYDNSSMVLNRNVMDLSRLAGREYELIYPLDQKGAGGRTMYEASPPMTLYRRLELEEITLPPGTYYLEYEVDDMFTRPFVLDRIEMRWDGKELDFLNSAAWEGRERLLTAGTD